MRFALTEEQSELVATVRTLVAKRATQQDLRSAIASASGFDQDLWHTLVDQIGVPALAIPEAYAGAGASYVEAHLVLEELGTHLTPTPFVGTLLATETLKAAAAGRDVSAPAPLLAAIAGGRPAALAVGADLVIDGPGAETIVLLSGDSLFEVDPKAAGCTLTPVESLDPTLRLARLRLDQPSRDLIGTVDPARIDAIGATVMTALQSGAARHALDLTVSYLKERHQFGRPLGSFQALKHRCADLLVQVETARTMSWAAAWELTQPTPDVRLIHAAKAWCSDAFSQVAAEMIQLHGGIGITWEHDAHLYFKRAHATAQLFGRAAQHRRQIMEDQ